MMEPSDHYRAVLHDEEHRKDLLIAITVGKIIFVLAGLVLGLWMATSIRIGAP